MSYTKRHLEAEAERRGVSVSALLGSLDHDGVSADELDEAIATTPDFFDELPDPS